MESSSSSRSRNPFGGSSSSTKIFDAFINHRGPDIKETLAFALCESLEEKGYWTFLDENKLELGDSITSTIEDAIYSSKVQIAIFSPHYAESPWCLNELLLMLETKALFIPIFCDVKPSELRYPDKEGSPYAAAFAEHEGKRRFSKEKLTQWKEALRSCADKSGYIISTDNDDVRNVDLETLCATIASAVQKEVGKKNFTEWPHLVFSCVCEILRHLISSISHRSGLHADVAASTSTSAMVKKSSLLPRDSHPVGLQSKLEVIRRLLQNPQVPVIAVVGMGGSGKTFLLQNVYNEVKSGYDHSIWLSVSKSYSLKNLQHDIASHIGLGKEIVDGQVTEARAAELIQEHLQGKRCLIVLDDLWELFTENSLIDKLGLPPHEDCKIVITTRSMQVAQNCRAEIYKMKILSEEDSWRLFCVYAFQNNVENRGQLEEEGRKIVKQCGNLPLAIKTIAASLANSRDLSKWKLKRRQLEKVVTPIGDPDHLAIMKILKLSYDDLPAQLKPCFSYLSFFSEDEKINAEYLIYLWIAEGLVPPGEEQWDMGWDFLDQLAQLCLIQVYEIADNVIERRLCKYCNIHDLLYDLAIQISKENRCVFSVEEVSSQTSGATGWCRILLAKKDLHEFAISENRPVYLRTLSLSQNKKITSIPENLFTAMRGLGVLDLSCTGISTLPASLGKMILLKVLNLRKTQIGVVPECVRYLKSLFFLALSTNISELPEWISELKYLQHLEWSIIIYIPKGISKLSSLKRLRSHTAPWLSIEEDGFMRLDDLVNMTQLDEVSLDLTHEMDLKRTEEGILAQLVNMRHLHIHNFVTGFGQLSEKMRAMKHLEYLRLHNFVIPGWICQLENLRELYLRSADMQTMPKEFGKSGAFPLLHIFKIEYFCSLEEFPELEEGAMPSLQKFTLRECSKLKKVEGLERLKTVEVFDFYRSAALSESVREGGEYWNKIKTRNPHVEFIE